MNISKYLLLGCFYTFVFSQNIYGQYRLNPDKKLDQYNYEHWDSQRGLPDNAVIHMLQSKDGYIWLASYGGITRFNGVDFLTYSSFNNPLIINNSFTYIYEDDSGVIWTATSGNGAVTVDNGKLKIYSVEDGLPSNFVEEIVQDQNGRIWIATSDGLSYKVKDRFVNEEVPDSLKHRRLKSIDVDADNALWIGTTDQGVYKVVKGKIVHHFGTQSGLLSDNINYVKYEGGKVWIGHDQGLSIIENNEIKNVTPKDGLPNNMISTSLIDHNGMVWVGSFRGMGRSDSLMNWSYFSSSHPLYENDFTSMLQDKEGNLWLGTYRQGLYKLWDGKFTNFSEYGTSDMQAYIVHCILKNKGDGLLVINETGVDILWPEINKLEPYDVNHDFSDTKLKFGLLDSKGILWIATQDYLVKYSNGVSTVIDTEDGLIHNSVRVLKEDDEGNIWAGTTNGISVIKPDGSITNYSAEDGLSHEYIMSIQSDTKGNLWIGTRNGLNVFKDGDFVSFQADDGLAGEFVFKTFEDSDGVLWVCGNAGLTRYKDGEFKKITTQAGLASNTLFQLLEDDLGYFWMTTNQKNITVFKVHKDELNAYIDGGIDSVKSIVYTQADGLKCTSATSSAMSLETSEGRLWLATTQGVEMIDPTDIEINKKEPPVKIESFNVNNKAYPLDSAISVPSGKDRISIHFSALSYVASSTLEYKYKLEGYDKSWQNPGNRRETSYTNLPFGEYTFRVKAANSDGVWNEKGASLTFVIRPAFYETNIFIISSIVALVLIAIAIFKLRVRSLEKAKVDLAKIVESRTIEVVKQKEEIESQKNEIEAQQAQIEHKNLELQKVNINLEDIVQERTEQLKRAYDELVEVNEELDTFIYRSVHDVRGPLARLQGLSHLISLETSDESILKLVKKLNSTADEMNDVFYSLLNIARLKSSELLSVKVNVGNVVNRITQKLLSSGHQIEAEVEVDNNFDLFTDEEILEIILYHLIENAYKFRKDDTIAKVIVKCEMIHEKNASIKVKDQGRGLASSVAERIFDMFYVGQEEVRGSGLGLYTVKTAIKVLQGDVKLVANALTDSYTTFEIKLPSHLSYTEANSIKKAAP